MERFPLTDKHKETASDLASKLIEGFNWGNTPQGHDFWDTVYENLNALSAGSEEVWDRNKVLKKKRKK